MAVIQTRYGHSERVSDPNSDWVTRKLIEELRIEQCDEPDNEHTQVSVANEHWAVTAQVSGLITFDNMDILEGEESDLPEEMYLRDVSDDRLVCIWQAVVRNDKESLLQHSWQPFESLPPYVTDYYRSGAKQ